MFPPRLFFGDGIVTLSRALSLYFVMMALLLDAVVVLAALLGLICGWRRGFVRGLLGGLRTILALALALALASPLAAPIERAVQPALQRAADELIEPFNDEEEVQALLGEEGSALRAAVSFLHLPQEELLEGELSSGGGESLRERVLQRVTAPLARGIALAAAFAAVFLAALIVLALLMKVLRVAERLPILGKVNAALGALLGVALAAVFLFVADLLLEAALPLLAGRSAALFPTDLIERTRLFQWVAGVNPLRPLLANMMRG